MASLSFICSQWWEMFVLFATYPWAFWIECIYVVQFFQFFFDSLCHSFVCWWNVIPVFLLWFQKVLVQKVWSYYGCILLPFGRDFCSFLLSKERQQRLQVSMLHTLRQHPLSHRPKTTFALLQKYTPKSQKLQLECLLTLPDLLGHIFNVFYLTHLLRYFLQNLGHY